MNEDTNRTDSRASPGTAARDMAMAALTRVEALIESPDTDPRVLLQAAKLVLSLAESGEDAADGGGFELRFTGGADDGL